MNPTDMELRGNLSWNALRNSIIGIPSTFVPEGFQLLVLGTSKQMKPLDMELQGNLSWNALINSIVGIAPVVLAIHWLVKKKADADVYLETCIL